MEIADSSAVISVPIQDYSRSLSLTSPFHTSRIKWQRNRYRRRYNGGLLRAPSLCHAHEMKFAFPRSTDAIAKDEDVCRFVDRKLIIPSCLPSVWVLQRRWSARRDYISISCNEFHATRMRGIFFSYFNQRIFATIYLSSYLFILWYEYHVLWTDRSFINKTQQSYLPSKNCLVNFLENQTMGVTERKRKKQLSASKRALPDIDQIIR